MIFCFSHRLFLCGMKTVIVIIYKKAVFGVQSSNISYNLVAFTVAMPNLLGLPRICDPCSLRRKHKSVTQLQAMTWDCLLLNLQ